MPESITDADLELLGELGVESAPTPSDLRSTRSQRIIAGFEEVERFVSERGRLPQHGESRDIFERLYAVRLDRMRASEECREILAPIDTRALLNPEADLTTPELSDAELLASLGVASVESDDVTRLVHVRSRAEVKAAEEVAQRAPCPDFDCFKLLFDRVQSELESGVRRTMKYRDNAEIRAGDLFIVEGQIALVAEMGEEFISDYNRPDRRLRVIYDNATQNDLLLRSLQRALNRDKASRRINEPEAARNLSLFADDADGTGDAHADTDAVSSGTIYVLRSLSEHPFIAEHRAVIHKIGVTGGDVHTRIANARRDPTFLLADAEIVATFKLENIDRHKLEALLHKFFGGARLDMELVDRFDTPVKPREWFFVPVPVIRDVIEKINEGTLDRFRYDVETASLKPV